MRFLNRYFSLGGKRERERENDTLLCALGISACEAHTKAQPRITFPLYPQAFLYVKLTFYIFFYPYFKQISFNTHYNIIFIFLLTCIWECLHSVLPLVSLGQAFPERISSDHAFNELLPQHTLRDDPLPLLTYQLCCTQRACIQERQDVLRYVIQALG